MKLAEVYNAHRPLYELYRLRLPYPKLREVKRLLDRAEPEAEFFNTEKNKLLERYAKHGPDGKLLVQDGRVSFASQELYEEYVQKMAELGETEIDFPVAPVQLTAEEIGNQAVSGEMVESLKGFVGFGGD